MEALMIIGAIIAFILFIGGGINLHEHAESTYGAGVFRLGALSASVLSIILGFISLGLTDADGSFTLNGLVVLGTAIVMLGTLIAINISKMNLAVGIFATFYQLTTSIFALAIVALLASASSSKSGD